MAPPSVKIGNKDYPLDFVCFLIAIALFFLGVLGAGEYVKRFTAIVGADPTTIGVYFLLIAAFFFFVGRVKVGKD